jgi:hypothetical protein
MNIAGVIVCNNIACGRNMNIRGTLKCTGNIDVSLGAGVFFNAAGTISLKANNISNGIPTQKGKLEINFKTRKELTCNYLFFEVNIDLETSFVLSKYKPKTVLKRDINMSMIVIEFVNILIINIKLNENNKMEQIKYIKKMLDKYDKKNVILVGDLNFDYNMEDDLIKKELVQIGFVDTCYIDKYTYDTTVNKMCWNLTYTRNRIRNNVILYKTSKFKPDKIHLFGTQHVFSIDKNDAEVNKFITENNFDPRFIKLTNDKIPFWPSYSFGLAAQFIS